EQGIVELFAEKDVEAESRLVKDEESGVNGHDEGKVELRDHALREFLDGVGEANAGFGEEAFGFGATEARVDACDVVERVGNANPARENGDVSNEGDIAHELVALGPRITAEDIELTLIGREAENGVEGRGLPCSIGTDDAKDAAFFDTKVDA